LAFHDHAEPLLQRKDQTAQPATPDCQYWHVRGREIEAALIGLPQVYREAVVLVLVTGESYVSASNILGCDIGTIKSRVSRGRRLLQAQLGESA
jgi:RNA polymerase sigma-70 factor, ECF subfamily